MFRPRLPQSPSRHLRIAQVVFSLEPGGMENGVVNIANSLPPQQFETHILCLEKPGEFASRLRPEVGCTALGRNAGWDWQACTGLSGALADLKPDIIHTHNLGPAIYAATARSITPKLWSVPIVHGEHGVLQGDNLSPRRLRQRRWLYRLCRRIHTVSGAMRDHLVELGMPPARLVSILNGVDTDRFCPPENKAHARAKLGLPQGALVIGHVGRYIPTKRHHLLIDAFEQIGAKFAHGYLVLLGDGGTEKQAVLEHIRQSPVRRQIINFGHQPDPAPFYQAMDLLVMPSSHEGLANALLEAMATGVPALAHNACGANEVIQDKANGFLASIDSSHELAQLVIDALDDQDSLRAVGLAARTHACGAFSLASMISKYAELYRECANCE